ncbi:MAG: response regulator transcription factor [Pseudomonadota bacterium]
MDITPKITIVIVEDHPEFRDALCRTFATDASLQVLETCRDLPAAARVLEQRCPAVLLVDLGLPSGSGLALIHQARQRWGNACASAVLTVTGNEEFLLPAIAAGAKGYVFKSDLPADHLEAVHLLAQGQSPLQTSLAQHFHQLLLQRSDADAHTLELLQYIAAGYSLHEGAARLSLAPREAGLRMRAVYDLFQQDDTALSKRELELMHLLNKGYPFKHCAELMSISEATAKTLASRAYHKLGVNNLQSALYEARAANLIF